MHELFSPGLVEETVSVKREATDPPPVTVIERRRTPCYALGWKIKDEDYQVISCPPYLPGFFIFPRWRRARPLNTYLYVILSVSSMCSSIDIYGRIEYSTSVAKVTAVTVR